MHNIKQEDLIVLYSEFGQKKIRLRPIQENDTDYILQWRNEDWVRSNFIFRNTLTFDMHRNWLYSNVYPGKAIQYIIEDANKCLPIGSIYIRDINLRDESGEFGIFIGEQEYAAKGYGTLAIQTFIPFCFSLGFHRIFLRVFKENVLANHVYFKTGFCVEGIARDMVFLNGKRHDIVFMSIINDNC